MVPHSSLSVCFGPGAITFSSRPNVQLNIPNLKLFQQASAIINGPPSERKNARARLMGVPVRTLLTPRVLIVLSSKEGVALDSIATIKPELADGVKPEVKQSRGFTRSGWARRDSALLCPRTAVEEPLRADVGGLWMEKGCQLQPFTAAGPMAADQRSHSRLERCCAPPRPACKVLLPGRGLLSRSRCRAAVERHWAEHCEALFLLCQLRARSSWGTRPGSFSLISSS